MTIHGQHKRDLRIVPHQPGWAKLFEEEAKRLQHALGGKALRIEHVGSTAVPGLAAKPIIDIMVAVTSLAAAAGLIPVLEALGYMHKPHDTIPDRLFLAKENAPEHRTHHLSLAETNSGYWIWQLAFRDYLRTHDATAAEYVALKRQIAKEYARTKQLDREAKTAFVFRVLASAASKAGHDSPLSYVQPKLESDFADD